MNKKCDIVLINPGDRKRVFQDLGMEVAAIEPPFWIVVIAAYLRDKGFKVAVIDANAKNIPPEETAARADALKPLLSVVIVYGSQPSASTQNMPSAGRICTELTKYGSSKVAIGGLHPSALPGQTLDEEDVDFVIDGEAILTLEKLLEKLQKGETDYKNIGGLWWEHNGITEHTERYPVIKDLDAFLPVGAWDLLPMDIYRAHNCIVLTTSNTASRTRRFIPVLAVRSTAYSAASTPRSGNPASVTAAPKKCLMRWSCWSRNTA